MPSEDYRYLRSFYTVGEIRRGIGVTVLAATFGALFYTQAVPLSIPFASYAVEMGVTNAFMAIIVTTLPLANVFEIIMAYMIQRTGKRQEFFAYGLIGSRVLWLPIVLIPFVWGPDHQSARMAALVVLLFLSSIISVAGGNAWGTWMGDLIPGTLLGRYFGFRQVFTVLSAIVVGVAAGFYLDLHRGPGGFLVVYSVLLIFGVADIVLFIWVPHPPMRPRPERHSLLDMVRIPLSDARYRNVIVLFAIFNFTANLVSPYVGLFLVRKEYAGLSNGMANIYGGVGGLCLVVTSYFLGRLSDRFGAKRVLVACLVMASIPPLFYLFVTPGHTWPILIAMVAGNIGWGGMFVVSMQLIIGLAPANERSMYLACQSAIMGLVIVGSYLAGGAVVKLLEGFSWQVPGTPWVWRDLHILFLISGLARFLTFIPLKRIVAKSSE